MLTKEKKIGSIMDIKKARKNVEPFDLICKMQKCSTYFQSWTGLNMIVVGWLNRQNPLSTDIELTSYCGTGSGIIETGAHSHGCNTWTWKHNN